ncbi:hypothetical protein CTM96_21465 [Photobacterium phosphoreum]|uniref:Uncharacterized protein n=1 Tax=Photobacterium phosphoreum TaxID=659 RepID=A0A2T3JAS4_PHOPO|nr:hypothetical protein CTM96_21465 [Photobacterium phosphoreum]PSU45912.1 hypothetical protein C9J18_21390 [Photobacterium phosphoreum]
MIEKYIPIENITKYKTDTIIGLLIIFKCNLNFKSGESLFLNGVIFITLINIAHIYIIFLNSKIFILYESLIILDIVIFDNFRPVK